MPKSPRHPRAKKAPRLYTRVETKKWCVLLGNMRDAAYYVRMPQQTFPTWTVRDEWRANRQGWFMGESPPYILSMRYEKDKAAMRHVVCWAGRGDPTCKKALTLVTARKLRGE